MIYAVQSLIVDCNFPRWMTWTSLAYGVSIIALFLNFYFHAYIKNKSHTVCLICIFSFLLTARFFFIILDSGIIHASQSLLVGCEFPLWMQYAVVFYAFSILLLFLNFYFQAYIKSHRKPKVIEFSLPVLLFRICFLVHTPYFCI